MILLNQQHTHIVQAEAARMHFVMVELSRRTIVKKIERRTM